MTVTSEQCFIENVESYIKTVKNNQYFEEIHIMSDDGKIELVLKKEKKDV